MPSLPEYEYVVDLDVSMRACACVVVVFFVFFINECWEGLEGGKKHTHTH